MGLTRIGELFIILRTLILFNANFVAVVLPDPKESIHFHLQKTDQILNKYLSNYHADNQLFHTKKAGKVKSHTSI